MKKQLVSILLATLVMTFAGCGGKNSSQADFYAAGGVQTEVHNTGETKKSSDGGITKEVLLSYAETSAEDFDYLRNDDGGVEIAGYNGNDEIIVIPEEIDGEPVIGIAKSTFQNNLDIKAVKLSDSVTNLGERAFAGSNLEIIICGNGLETIEESAFSQCQALKVLELNDGIKTMKKRAFMGCDSLESVYIPDSVEEIEILAFYTLNEDLTIQGKSGSVAETYAQSEDIKFEAQ